jgi:uncharacterized protein YdhG (YjbR/CyaY superfamily)
MTTGVHDEHIAGAAPAIQGRLTAIRAEIHRLVPGAEECISYRMPAFRQGKVFFYYAAFKQHIGIYPPVKEPAGLIAELAPWRGPKGNLAFPHKEPLPLDLIGRTALALAAQYAKG